MHGWVSVWGAVQRTCSQTWCADARTGRRSMEEGITLGADTVEVEDPLAKGERWPKLDSKAANPMELLDARFPRLMRAVRQSIDDVLRNGTEMSAKAVRDQLGTAHLTVLHARAFFPTDKTTQDRLNPIITWWLRVELLRRGTELPRGTQARTMVRRLREQLAEEAAGASSSSDGACAGAGAAISPAPSPPPTPSPLAAALQPVVISPASVAASPAEDVARRDSGDHQIPPPAEVEPPATRRRTAPGATPVSVRAAAPDALAASAAAATREESDLVAPVPRSSSRRARNEEAARRSSPPRKRRRRRVAAPPTVASPQPAAHSAPAKHKRRDRSQTQSIDWERPAQSRRGRRSTPLPQWSKTLGSM